MIFDSYNALLAISWAPGSLIPIFASFSDSFKCFWYVCCISAHLYLIVSPHCSVKSYYSCLVCISRGPTSVVRPSPVWTRRARWPERDTGRPAGRSVRWTRSVWQKLHAPPHSDTPAGTRRSAWGRQRGRCVQTSCGRSCCDAVGRTAHHTWQRNKTRRSALMHTCSTGSSISLIVLGHMVSPSIVFKVGWESDPCELEPDKGWTL